jgi:hypothetical protein
MKNDIISDLVVHLYNSQWLKQSINNICKKLSKDKKEDLEQYIYLYILEHPKNFTNKPSDEIKYYLITTIQNQYNLSFRNKREIVDSDLLYKLSNTQ